METKERERGIISNCIISSLALPSGGLFGEFISKLQSRNITKAIRKGLGVKKCFYHITSTFNPLCPKL